MWGNFWVAICMNYDDKIFTTELQTQFCTRGGAGMIQRPSQHIFAMWGD